MPSQTLAQEETRGSADRLHGKDASEDDAVIKIVQKWMVLLPRFSTECMARQIRMARKLTYQALCLLDLHPNRALPRVCVLVIFRFVLVLS